MVPRGHRNGERRKSLCRNKYGVFGRDRGRWDASRSRPRGSKRLTEPFVAGGVFERSSTATPTVGNGIVAVGTSSSPTSCVVSATRCGRRGRISQTRRRLVRVGGRKASGLIRERASPYDLWSLLPGKGASDLRVIGPPAPDEIMWPRPLRRAHEWITGPIGTDPAPIRCTDERGLEGRGPGRSDAARSLRYARHDGLRSARGPPGALRRSLEPPRASETRPQK